MSTHCELDSKTIHKAWDNSLTPRLIIDAGDTVTFHTRDAADNYYSRYSKHEDVVSRGPLVGHPLTGPVYGRARPPSATFLPLRYRRGTAVSYSGE